MKTATENGLKRETKVSRAQEKRDHLLLDRVKTLESNAWKRSLEFRQMRTEKLKLQGVVSEVSLDIMRWLVFEMVSKVLCTFAAIELKERQENFKINLKARVIQFYYRKHKVSAEDQEPFGLTIFFRRFCKK